MRRVHRGGGVPLPAPRARWRAVRAAERDGHRCRRRRRGGGHRAHPARRRLPRRRLRPPAGAFATPVRRRIGGRLDGPGGIPGRRAADRTVRADPGRRGHPLGPCRSGRRPAGRRRVRAVARPGAARPPLGAAGGERCGPGGHRSHADPTAGRCRRARPAQRCRPRDAPDRRRHRRPRGRRLLRRHLPDHRGRPGRRPTPRRCSSGCGRSTGARRRSARGDRPVRAGTRAGVRRTVGDRPPGNLLPGSASHRRHAGQPRGRRFGRRRPAGRQAGGFRRRPHGLRRPRCCGATPGRCGASWRRRSATTRSPCARTGAGCRC